jgi:hypothetical protein
MADGALSIRRCTKNVDLWVTSLENPPETFKMVADVVLYLTMTCLKEKVYRENNHKTKYMFYVQQVPG